MISRDLQDEGTNHPRFLAVLIALLFHAVLLSKDNNENELMDLVSVSISSYLTATY